MTSGPAAMVRTINARIAVASNARLADPMAPALQASERAFRRLRIPVPRGWIVRPLPLASGAVVRIVAKAAVAAVALAAPVGPVTVAPAARAGTVENAEIAEIVDVADPVALAVPVATLRLLLT